MGQDQSAVVKPAVTSGAQSVFGSTPASDDHGVRVVQASGGALTCASHGADIVDRALAESSTLPLPQPVLPPPPVKDDVTSALQGAAMVHELRSLVGGWLPTRDLPTQSNRQIEQIKSQQSTSASSMKQALEPPDESGISKTEEDPAPVAKTKAQGQDITSNHGIRPALRETHPAQKMNATAQDIRAEQEAWKQVTVDRGALEAVLSEINGGERMSAMVERQAALMSRVKTLATLTNQLKVTVNNHVEQAKISARVSDRLDRLKISFADVQDVIEQSVATANILGAAHFADDQEMQSFKCFLKYNPPNHSKDQDM